MTCLMGRGGWKSKDFSILVAIFAPLSINNDACPRQEEIFIVINRNFVFLEEERKGG